MALQDVVLDVQTVAQLGALLRSYNALLSQTLSVQQQIADLLTRQVGPELQVVERSFVTEREAPSVQAQAAPAPLIISSIEGPIRQQKPSAVNHYNLTTDSGTIGKTSLFPGFKTNTPLWVVIYNTDLTNSVALSWDNQKTFFKMPKNSSLNFAPFTWPENVTQFYYKSDDALSVAIDIIAGE